VFCLLQGFNAPYNEILYQELGEDYGWK